ncbi:uncharacterized protein At3g60930, chloroplastic-like [Eutrema salsugineum]|uniref:uncharacterized protein At3g60930, chloroplastic-like n=1 Tax=Eutrema salsugineum TaxID=72664 RepID=UPI000CED4409|nr:uncharacterized protein At3g60930, chloroplastic-like [Eutrema salsugineum]
MMLRRVNVNDEAILFDNTEPCSKATTRRFWLTPLSRVSRQRRGDFKRIPSRVNVNDYAILFDNAEPCFKAKRKLELLVANCGASGRLRPRKKKRQRPNPPGSSLSSAESLEALRIRFGISEVVVFVMPSPTDRAKLLPPNHLTVILRYLWKHGISIGQIVPRGLRHMIGILVLSFECHIDVTLDHLLNFLEIRKAPEEKRFYISSKARHKIICGFPSKDFFWDDRFFYVLVNEASVGDFADITKIDWGPLVRSILPPVLEDLFDVRDALAAWKNNWKRHFSLERVERARSILAGVPVCSGSSNSSGDTGEKMVIVTLRERKRREAEAAAKRAEEADQQAEEGDIVSEASTNALSEPQESAVPTASAVLALPQSRPTASYLIGHKASNCKCTAVEKGKGLTAPKPSKKKTRRVNDEPVERKLIIDDPVASARLFAKVNSADVSFPPPEKFRRSKPYAAMAQRETKFNAAINELMAGYEADAVKIERAQSRVVALEDEKKALKAEYDRLVSRFEESRVRKNNEISSLKRQIEAKDALFESKVKIAKKEAWREAAAKFQERFSKIEKKMEELEKAKRDENDLGQIRSNLVLISDLRKPDATLDAEEEKLKTWEAEVIGAEERFERIATDRRGELVVSPVSRTLLILVSGSSHWRFPPLQSVLWIRRVQTSTP